MYFNFNIYIFFCFKYFNYYLYSMILNNFLLYLFKTCLRSRIKKSKYYINEFFYVTLQIKLVIAYIYIVYCIKIDIKNKRHTFLGKPRQSYVIELILEAVHRRIFVNNYIFYKTMFFVLLLKIYFLKIKFIQVEQQRI